MRLTLPRHVPLVAALGVTQIIGYGSIYYAFPILAPSVAQEFAVSEPFLFGLLSAGLLLGGLAAPALGGLLDRIGAGRVMTMGSLAMAVLLTLLAGAPNIHAFGALTILIEILSFAVLYDAAFSMLAQKRPGATRQAITRLTLIAGFASTIFWPLSAVLVTEFGWRGTLLVFAASHLVGAALHHRMTTLPVMAGPDPGTDRAPPSPAGMPTVMADPVALQAFLLLAVGFALTGMAISAVTVHLVQILRSLHLGEAAYLAAMVLGPAQVAVRVMDATLWRDRHPLFIAILSAAAIVLALTLLLVPGPPALTALAFPAIMGAGAGLSSIVRGAVPVALFGASGLGRRLGRLAAIRNILGASAPFLFAWAAASSMIWAVGAALALAVAGLAALLLLQDKLQRIGIVPPLRSGRR